MNIDTTIISALIATFTAILILIISNHGDADIIMDLIESKEVLQMTYEKWIELLVPIIGIIVAAVSAGLTYLFAKKKQILADECRLKEKYYLNFIEAVSNIVVSNHSSYRKSTEEIETAHIWKGLFISEDNIK